MTQKSKGRNELRQSELFSKGKPSGATENDISLIENGRMPRHQAITQSIEDQSLNRQQNQKSSAIRHKKDIGDKEDESQPSFESSGRINDFKAKGSNNQSTDAQKEERSPMSSPLKMKQPRIISSLKSNQAMSIIATASLSQDAFLSFEENKRRLEASSHEECDNNDSIQIILAKLQQYKSINPQSAISEQDNTNFFVIKLKYGLYYGEIRKNKERNGQGIMFYDSGKSYEGQWQSDKKNGQGVEYYQNGSYYKGFFKDGKYENNGIFTWGSGEYYEGEWHSGQKHGKGTWRSLKGDEYSGEWRDGKAHGRGIHIWQNGDQYEGEFQESLKHGKGTENFANGDRFVGNFVHGKPSGIGEYYWSNGSEYKGEFLDGLRDGKGIYTNFLDEQYNGQYKADQKHGYGEFKWASGNYYKGGYANDLRDGYGEIYWKDGSCYKGEWHKGIQHGNGEMYIPGKYIMTGIFRNNQFIEAEGTMKKLPLQHSSPLKSARNENRLPSLKKYKSERTVLQKKGSKIKSTHKL